MPKVYCKHGEQGKPCKVQCVSVGASNVSIFDLSSQCGGGGGAKAVLSSKRLCLKKLIDAISEDESGRSAHPSCTCLLACLLACCLFAFLFAMISAFWLGVSVVKGQTPGRYVHSQSVNASAVYQGTGDIFHPLAFSSLCASLEVWQ